MSVNVEKLEKNMAKLTVEVSAEDFEKAIQGAYLKQKNRINIPGFRKGKAPRVMIEKMYGAGIFYEDAANALIPEAYSTQWMSARRPSFPVRPLRWCRLRRASPLSLPQRWL